MMKFTDPILVGAVVSMALSGVTGTCDGQDTRTPPAIPAVGERMRRSVDAREIAGAVTLVATPDRVVHLDATGQADIAAGRAMRPDTIFWIASMTKPVTASAVLMLQDEGKLSVDDPVEKYIPEFKRLRTAGGEPARVTIRHLLTHTSGMGEISADEARGIKDLAGLIPLYVAKPVEFPPGSKWDYCQSGINTAGRIVEVVSGEPFVEFLDRRLFGPLGMKDTTFYLSDEQLSRLATSYGRTGEGELKEAANRILLGKGATSRDRFPAANGGLFSTAPDYARFGQMILRGGERAGKRYLKPESVKLMTSLQSDDLKTGFTPGCGWGLGWCVVREPQGVTAMLSPGTYGHGGAYGTQAWIDPGKGRIYILMIQRADFPNSDASEVRRAFQEAAAPKDYPLGPDSLPQDGVPRGKLEGPFLFRSKFIPGTVRKYWVHVPAQYSAEKPACVLVFQDGARAINPKGVLRVPTVLDNLIHKKEMPVTLGIFVTPGQRGEEFPESIGTGNPNNRSLEYDSLGDAYARFLVDELLPEVGKTYKLTDDPEGRAIGGASSGAICAFTVAWERPDEFRKVISLIGSFTDLRGGHVYPDLIREADKKPIRVFLQDGVNDNRNARRPERDWHVQNQAMVAALEAKGYDLKYVFGEGGHSDNHGGALLPDILRWLWRDYSK
jgi:CubicO group peptidase (beta-lactamase class C family)/predicted alpha/beta superfamily hydrolase